MSENNYGALMMKSTVGVSDDINAILSPGIYPIPPANTSSPDSTGGVLTIHSGSPVRRTFTSDSIIHLTSTRNGNAWTTWKGPLSRTNPFSDIKSDGSVDEALQNLGLSKPGKATITSSGTFVVPDSITEIYVSACAAGGGGAPGAGGSNVYFGGGGGGGGAGQSIIKKKFTVTPGSTITITIGAAGTGGVGNVDRGGIPTAGGDTIIGSLQTLKGGSGGGNAINGTDGATGGLPGVGYPAGGYGNDGYIVVGSASGGSGASSPFGGGGGSGRAGTNGGMSGHNADGYGAGGGGGGGKYGNNTPVASGGSGGNGAPGFVVVEW